MATDAEVEFSSNGTTNLIDLPDTILTQILCSLPLESVSAASKSCSSLRRIINSADFYRAYVPQHGWIVADSAGAECDPALLFYNTLSNIWRSMPIPDICRDHILLKPRMVSASGRLILLVAIIRRTCFEQVLLSGPELVVVNPLTRKSRRLPNPPLFLNSSKLCIEMVTFEASYKVILFSTRMASTVFVYGSGVGMWKRVDVSGPLIPSGSGAVYRSSSVVYKGVLCWLITTHSCSYLVFYGIQRDRAERKSVCFYEQVYGIGVCRLGIVGVTKEGLCRLDLSRDRWIKISFSATGGQLDLGLNMDVKMATVCSSEEEEEEEDGIWVLSLNCGGFCNFRGSILRRHMNLISYQFCNRRWRQLCPCFIQSDAPPAVNPRSISQAKWIKWRFEASP